MPVFNEMNNNGKIDSNSPEATFEHGKNTAVWLPLPLVLLSGQLGAGKTIWTKGFARGLNLSSEVYSPSYTIMNVYTENEKVLYHFDLYRIDSIEEVFDTGFFEIIESGKPCVVEWADRVPRLSGLKHLRVTINSGDNISSTDGVDTRNTPGWRAFSGISSTDGVDTRNTPGWRAFSGMPGGSSDLRTIAWELKEHGD